ncbi:MAG: circularly permuted type 2 ATP-grasp protein [Dehalococcoidia bacterium]
MMTTIPVSLDTSLNECLNSDGSVRPLYRSMMDQLQSLGNSGLRERWRQANRQVSLDAFTFLLDPHQFRPVPSDWIPRLIPIDHWSTIAAGVAQRLKALNGFLMDLYCGRQDVVPEEVIYTSNYFYPNLQGFLPPGGVFAHIYGIDLVHLGDGKYYVLEDNLRIPSGIAYQMKSREIMSGFMPEFAGGYDILPYDIRGAYHHMFASLCNNDSPTCVLLTDSKFGSAFFEHRYLSELLGIPLVEGSDLYIGHDGRVWTRALDQDFPVDLIYRRVEDLELFVPHVVEAYLNKKVILVNAMGAGAADDKLVFTWVPEMIRGYLGQEPLLPQATSYKLQSVEERRYVLDNLDDLVLKTRQGYGGIGVFIMPDLGPTYRTHLMQQIVENPEGFIAQDTLDFSKHLVFDGDTGEFGERYVDLRVYAIQDAKGQVTVFPGGLTRVAQPTGRVTNNSSGGLCKPTWVVQ